MHTSKRQNLQPGQCPSTENSECTGVEKNKGKNSAKNGNGVTGLELEMFSKRKSELVSEEKRGASGESKKPLSRRAGNHENVNRGKEGKELGLMKEMPNTQKLSNVFQERKVTRQLASSFTKNNTLNQQSYEKIGKENIPISINDSKVSDIDTSLAKESTQKSTIQKRPMNRFGGGKLCTSDADCREPLMPLKSDLNALKKKQLLSVQEEFFKQNNKPANTSISSISPRKKSTSKDSQKRDPSKESATNEEVMEKYEFLRTGLIKISSKSAKYITTRIKPADCVIHLLDALFLLIGENKLKQDAKIRFAEYKYFLSRLDSTNDRLQETLLSIKHHPERHTKVVALASKSLELFVNESIFCDLVTLDYCKPLLWIVQGLIKYTESPYTPSETANTTVIHERVMNLPPSSTISSAVAASLSINVPKVPKAAPPSPTISPPPEPAHKLPNLPQQPHHSHLFYNPHQKVSVDTQHSSTAEPLAPFAQRSREDTLAGSKGLYGSNQSQTDTREYLSFGRTHAHNPGDLHLRESLTSFANLAAPSHAHLAQYPSLGNLAVTDPASLLIETTTTSFPQQQQYFSHSSHHGQGGVVNPVHHRSTDGKIFSLESSSTRPAIGGVAQFHMLSPPGDHTGVGQAQYNSKGSTQSEEDLDCILLYQTILECRSLLSPKFLTHIRSLTEASPPTILASRAFLSLVYALYRPNDRVPEEWTPIRAALTGIAVPALSVDLFNPDGVLAVPRQNIINVQILLIEYDRNSEYTLRLYYTHRMIGFIRKWIEMYYYSCERPSVYQDIYSSQLK